MNLPAGEIDRHVESFFVARSPDGIAGCAGLETYGDTGVLRSLAVAQSARGAGLGIRLADTIIGLARGRGLTKLVLLTETAAPFFEQHFGFETVAREAVSEEVRSSWQFTGAVCRSAACMWLDL